MIATTSTRWISPPAMFATNPISQSRTRIPTMAQSMGLLLLAPA
jgi:hypothetical protein